MDSRELSIQQEVEIIPNIVKTDAGDIDFGIMESVLPIPGLIHSIREACEEEGTCSLDNNSKWMSPKIEMVKNWTGDGLFLTQNQAVLSTYRFALANPRLQKAVPVSLLIEPLPVEDKTFFILSIDLPNDLLRLTNNTEWAVYSGDHGTLRKFSPHDRIIMGVNSSDPYDSFNLEKNKMFILINTTSNLYVRANPIVR